MIVISRKSDMVLEAANKIAEDRYRAPNVWAHRRQMLWLRKLNAVDLEQAKAFLKTAPPGMRWIASWPMAVATALNRIHPDVFNDLTGETMLKFLATEAGQPYRTEF